MSNVLDTIQLSGSSYDLKDKNAANVSAVTQAEYDNLPTSAKTSNTLFVITDAQAGDLTQYWTSAQTNSAITQATSGKVDTTTFNTYSGSVETALSGKQDTLVSGTNIKTINNESLLGSGNIDIQGGGGGGKAVEAGRGISVASGDSAYTVSFNLPISAGTGNGSIIGGRSGNITTPQASFAFGEDNRIEYDCAYASIYGYSNHIYHGSTGAHIAGVYNEARNGAECAVGKNNISNTGSTNADKTLFSVGNGTSSSARHNAFEIRQNGDIYLNNGTSDVKIQDYLQIKVVKLTQSEYDALSPNYDSNTLYVIVN